MKKKVNKIPIYNFWDIPSVMLASVKALIKIEKKALVTLVNAGAIKKEVCDLISNTKIKVIFLKKTDKGFLPD